MNIATVKARLADKTSDEVFQSTPDGVIEELFRRYGFGPLFDHEGEPSDEAWDFLLDQLHRESAKRDSPELVSQTLQALLTPVDSPPQEELSPEPPAEDITGKVEGKVGEKEPPTEPEVDDTECLVNEVVTEEELEHLIGQLLGDDTAGSSRGGQGDAKGQEEEVPPKPEVSPAVDSDTKGKASSETKPSPAVGEAEAELLNFPPDQTSETEPTERREVPPKSSPDQAGDKGGNPPEPEAKAEGRAPKRTAPRTRKAATTGPKDGASKPSETSKPFSWPKGIAAAAVFVAMVVVVYLVIIMAVGSHQSDQRPEESPGQAAADSQQPKVAPDVPETVSDADLHQQEPLEFPTAFTFTIDGKKMVVPEEYVWQDPISWDRAMFDSIINPALQGLVPESRPARLDDSLDLQTSRTIHNIRDDMGVTGFDRNMVQGLIAGHDAKLQEHDQAIGTLQQDVESLKCEVGKIQSDLQDVKTGQAETLELMREMNEAVFTPAQ